MKIVRKKLKSIIAMVLAILLLLISGCPSPIDLYDEVEQIVRQSQEDEAAVQKPSTPPSNFVATVISSSQIKLSWSVIGDNEDSFQIQVMVADVFQNLQTVDADCKEYIHIGLEASTTYIYRIRATNSAGASPWSSEAVTTTLADNSSAPSQDATISSIQLSDGSLAEEFNPAITLYHASVLFDENPIGISVFPSHDQATIEINEESVSPAQPHELFLDVGSNLVTIVVTAQAGNTLTYTVDITRLEDSTLSALQIDGLSLDGSSTAALYPEFSSSVNNYYMQVNSAETNIGITPTVANPQIASVKINGSVVNSGVTADYIPQKGELNAFAIEVTAGDNDTAHSRTYNVSIYVPLANVAATGQRTSYMSGDDGTLQSGLDWEFHLSERFVYTDAGDDWFTLDDRFTGLRWAHPTTAVSYSWSNALFYAQDAVVGTNLEDGWRIPNVHELESLVNYNESPTAWLPFTTLESDLYWTSTNYDLTSAYAVNMGNGLIALPWVGYSNNILLVKEMKQ